MFGVGCVFCSFFFYCRTFTLGFWKKRGVALTAQTFFVYICECIRGSFASSATHNFFSQTSNCRFPTNRFGPFLSRGVSKDSSRGGSCTFWDKRFRPVKPPSRVALSHSVITFLEGISRFGAWHVGTCWQGLLRDRMYSKACFGGVCVLSCSSCWEFAKFLESDEPQARDNSFENNESRINKSRWCTRGCMLVPIHTRLVAGPLVYGWVATLESPCWRILQYVYGKGDKTEKEQIARL